MGGKGKGPVTHIAGPAPDFTRQLASQQLGSRDWKTSKLGSTMIPSTASNCHSPSITWHPQQERASCTNKPAKRGPTLAQSSSTWLASLLRKRNVFLRCHHKPRFIPFPQPRPKPNHKEKKKKNTARGPNWRSQEKTTLPFVPLKTPSSQQITTRLRPKRSERRPSIGAQNAEVKLQEA